MWIVLPVLISSAMLLHLASFTAQYNRNRVELRHIMFCCIYLIIPCVLVPHSILSNSFKMGTQLAKQLSFCIGSHLEALDSIYLSTTILYGYDLSSRIMSFCFFSVPASSHCHPCDPPLLWLALAARHSLRASRTMFFVSAPASSHCHPCDPLLLWLALAARHSLRATPDFPNLFIRAVCSLST